MAVINNSEILECFNPQHGVRQRCPICPYLFIMSVALFVISMRENCQIQGIRILHSEIKLIQLAGDMTCFVTNIDSIIEIVNTFNKFKMLTDLKVMVLY